MIAQRIPRMLTRIGRHSDCFLQIGKDGMNYLFELGPSQTEPNLIGWDQQSNRAHHQTDFSLNASS